MDWIRVRFGIVAVVRVGLMANRKLANCFGQSVLMALADGVWGHSIPLVNI